MIEDLTLQRVKEILQGNDPVVPQSSLYRLRALARKFLLDGEGDLRLRGNRLKYLLKAARLHIARQALRDNGDLSRSPRILQGYLKFRKVYLPISEANELIALNRTHQLHRPQHISEKRQPRVNKPFIPRGPLDRLQIDLFDMQRYRGFNDARRYVFLAVDSFSKYLWCIPLTSKTAVQTGFALDRIIQEVRAHNDAIIQIITDKGAEFQGPFEELCEANRIKHITTAPYSPQSNGLAERMVRVVKNAIFSHFTAQDTKRYIDILDDIVRSYNSRVHTITKEEPRKVVYTHDRRRVQRVLKRIQSQALKNIRITTTQIDSNANFLFPGDKVRISLNTVSNIRRNRVLNKGVTQQWSTRIYTVRKRHDPRPGKIVREGYTLFDAVHNRIYYRNQLLLVKQPNESSSSESEAHSTSSSSSSPPSSSSSSSDEGDLPVPVALRRGRREIRPPRRYDDEF